MDIRRNSNRYCNLYLNSMYSYNQLIILVCGSYCQAIDLTI